MRLVAEHAASTGHDCVWKNTFCWEVLGCNQAMWWTTLIVPVPLIHVLLWYISSCKWSSYYLANQGNNGTKLERWTYCLISILSAPALTCSSPAFGTTSVKYEPWLFTASRNGRSDAHLAVSKGCSAKMRHNHTGLNDLTKESLFNPTYIKYSATNGDGICIWILTEMCDRNVLS